jgi:hypothetical protein
MARQELLGWSSSEQYSETGAVRFEQRVRSAGLLVDQTEQGALALGQRYWTEVERFTCRLVRVRQRERGLELRLLGVTLLRFGTPLAAVDESGTWSRFPIIGGLLARSPSGSITFAQTVGPAVELRATIDGFFPRFDSRPGHHPWTGALYRQVQRRLHLVISRRYFHRLLGDTR